MLYNEDLQTKLITKPSHPKPHLKQISHFSFGMKTASIYLGILLSLLLLLNFCYAAEENVAEFQPDRGAAGVATKNGEEDQEEKFKFLHHHKPLFKKPFLKPIPLKHPILKKPIPVHPFLKKPIPIHPYLKKPIPIHPYLKKPFNPPVFPSHP